MKKKGYRFTVSLPDLEGHFLERMIKLKPYGWLSEMFLDFVREKYGSIPTMQKIKLAVAKAELIEAQNKRDSAEKEIERQVNIITKLKEQQELKRW